ncbi:MAG TPA: ATP-binding protein [bacterium]|nr:ATP-binding protein [bacterium]HPN41856.1 ATP-binding protein [bacterium]
MKQKEKVQKYEKKIKEISKTLEELVWEMIRDLRESEQQYRSIVEFAADAIVSINVDKKVTSWNKGAVNVFGYSEAEVMGQDIDKLIAHENVFHEAVELSQKLLNGESIRSFEAIRYGKDGTPKNVLISAAPIFSHDNLVEAVSIMYKDISDLKQTHNQLVQTEKQATLGIIAGSIGHELNNLVGGMLIHARLIKENYGKPDRIKEYNEYILANLEKVAVHGKNLLSLSRPTKPQLEPLDLNVLLQQTTETLILSGVLKYVTIKTNLHKPAQPVYGDRNLLEQVIRNLEINAAHAMPTGGVLELATALSKDKNNFEIEFRDNGSGIPKELQTKIFEPFFTTKSAGKGTGLGLPIVKNILEQHKGYITLESQVGTGTTFTIGLPIAKTA